MARLIKYFFLFIYVISFTSYHYAATDSSCYPLRIGNEWNYSLSSSSLTEKLSDTLKVNGNLYFGLTRYITEPEYWLREYNLNSCSVITSVNSNYENRKKSIPKLFQNYPNLFNPVTEIS